MKGVSSRWDAKIIHLPVPNPFLPTDFSLRCKAGAAPETSTTTTATAVVTPTAGDGGNADKSVEALSLLPSRLTEASKSDAATVGVDVRLWHKLDSYWQVPKVNVVLLLESPLVLHRPLYFTLPCFLLYILLPTAFPLRLFSLCRPQSRPRRWSSPSSWLKSSKSYSVATHTMQTVPACIMTYSWRRRVWS